MDNAIEEQMKFWEDYQEKAWSTCLPSCQNRDYFILGLQSEIGELCGKFKKKIRGDYDDCPDNFLKDVKAEIGDILWYNFGLLRLSKVKYAQKVFDIIYDDRETVHTLVYWAASLPSYAGTFIRNIDYWIQTGECVFPELLSTLALIARSLGFSIEEAATANIEKLAKRYNTGKIMGSGDYR